MTDGVGAGFDARSGDRKRRWLWRALILSLSINLLIAGIFIGAKFSRDHGHRGGFAQQLEGERRQLFSDLARARHERFRADREEIRAKRSAAIKLMEAEPFDRAKLVSAVEDILSKRAEARRERAEQFLKMVDQMTTEERHAFVRWYEAKREHRRQKLKWRDASD